VNYKKRKCEDADFIKYKKVPFIKNIFMKDYLRTITINYLDKKMGTDILKNFKLINTYKCFYIF